MSTAAGHWTQEPPTDEGYYWICFEGDMSPSIVEFEIDYILRRRTGVVEWRYWVEDIPYAWEHDLSQGLYRWSAQLEPPAAPPAKTEE